MPTQRPKQQSSKPTTEAQKEATKRYDAKMTRQYHLKLNIKNDSDVIERLDQQKSMQGYIKGLIREDIKNDEHGKAP